ncbi:AAA family ATPase [Oceanirhabdus seepicola]|uniref:AAA family ATPase n=1 Tax=Oceanirhabdus seepicola TaxID=2828781 RepID=A0A9J6NX09_9CLOT|nr:AAA family ATPase [Oceanirhabdus seepicola]MCM1988803.1 AAA family ATPase [Oceanirhabdus seepicola]
MEKRENLKDAVEEIDSKEIEMDLEELLEESIDEDYEELIKKASKYDEIKETQKKIEATKKVMGIKNKKFKEKEKELEEKVEKFNREREEFIQKNINENDKKFEEIFQVVNKQQQEFQDKISELNRKLIESSRYESEYLALLKENELLKEDKQENTRRLIELNDRIKELEYLEDKIEIIKEVELLRDKVEDLEKDKNIYVQKSKDFEIKFNEEKNKNEEISMENSILKTKITRLKGRLQEFEEIEKRKGNSGDTTANTFKEYINSEKEIVKSTKFQPYSGDFETVTGFIKYASAANFEYDEKTIRAFLASVKSSKFTILKGFSGTGKSSLPKLFAKYLGAHCEVIPVQTNWKTKSDLLGFYNHFTNRFIPTKFTETLFRANVNKDKIFFVVLDEMNLSRVEYYFSEFNSKLWSDKDDRFIELFDGVKIYDEELKDYLVSGNKIAIPDNIIFIGTINEDDSVSPISDKIYDRAQVIDFITLPQSTSVGDIDKTETKDYSYTYERFMHNNNSNNGESYMLKFQHINKYMRNEFNKNLAFRSMKQIGDFCSIFIGSCDKRKDMKSKEIDVIDAIDMQLVSKFIPKIKYAYSGDFESKLKKFREEIVNSTFKGVDNIDDLQIFIQIDMLLKEIEY